MRFVCCGGIAEKNALVMQIYADIFDRPVKVSRCSQTCALGSAIAGAVVGGAYGDFATAADQMTGVKEKIYVPDPGSASVYRRLYALYVQLHDAFGKTGKDPSLENVMKDLIAIRQECRR